MNTIAAQYCVVFHHEYNECMSSGNVPGMGGGG